MEEKFFTNGFKFFIISTVVTVIMAVLTNHISKRIINRFNEKYKEKLITNQYLYQTIRAITWLVAAMVIFKQIIPLSSLSDTVLGATSIIAVAVGIAAQATFGNYVAGFFLAIHQPFKVGDIIFIKERGLSGTVKEINFRHTVLQTQEKTEIIIPNTFMNTAVIEDMSSGDYSELLELKVSGKTDLDKLQKIIEKLILDEKLTHNDKDNKLVIRNIDKDGYTIAFPIHTDSLIDNTKAKNNILPKLYKELKKNKIELI